MTESAAKNIDMQAAAWIERRHFGPWMEEDQAELETWLQQSIAHRVSYLRLNSNWNRTKRLVVLSSKASNAVTEVRKGTGFFLTKVAAGFVILTLAGLGAAHFLSQPGVRIFSTPVGGHETVTFSDGTRVELNTSTVLRARMTTDQRTIWLERGEAYFEVKHDPAHPFVVIAGDRRVTDLGTQFLVRRDRRDLKVAVIEGRVWFDTRDKRVSAQTSLLTTGDVATVSADKLSVTRSNVPELTDELAWRRGMLVFHRTPLGAAVAQFNRYNRDHLVIADTKTANLQIDGTFPANDPSAFTDIVQDILHLRITRQGNATLISR